MRPVFLFPLLIPVLLVAQVPKSAGRASAVVQVGTAVEQMELLGQSPSFRLATGTKLYAWTKITGAADSTITVTFSRGDRSSKQQLKVPRSPYRTNAYRTFRKGDGGDWSVKILAADGAELGAATFKVEIE